MNNKVKITPNNRGGFSISLPPQEVGNFATIEDATRAAKVGGYIVERDEPKKEMRTVREWFKLLPNDIERMAIDNLYRPELINAEEESLAKSLLHHVQFKYSEQGNMFWHDILDRAINGEYNA